MYVQFFGLQQAPFSIAPDPRYLFMSERHREALAHLLYGVGGGGGFVLLSGEIGTGKTTICRCFLEQVPAGCQVAYIFNPRLTVHELLQSVCEEFGITVPAPAAGLEASAKACIAALNAHLLAAHAQGRHCVLIIDEAQNLAPEVLEQLRLLTNLETHERKLLQIMLIGQPELREMLARPGLEQLAQRVIARYHLGPLTAGETAAYLAHRLAVAGRQGALPFDTAALRRIHQISGGVPRRINLLADRALLGAFAEGRAQVGRRIVNQAAREVFDAGRAGRTFAVRAASAGPIVGALAAGVALGAVLLWAAGRSGPDWAPVGTRAAVSAASVARAASAAAASGPADAGATAVAASPPASAPSAAELALGLASAAALRPVATAAPVAGAGATRAATPVAVAASSPDAIKTLATWPRDEAAGWRELAGLWGVTVPLPGPADPCQALRAQALRCFRSSGITLAQLRQMDRPGLLALTAGDGQPRWARLQTLGVDRVQVAHAGQTLSLPLGQFSRLWRGDFATLWRPPVGYGDTLQAGARGPAVDALAQALASTLQLSPPPPGQVLAGALAARLASFQVAHSLRPDGMAGPTTFMPLNRATGVAEPRLAPAER